jgi:hypothetical protein
MSIPTDSERPDDLTSEETESQRISPVSQLEVFFTLQEQTLKAVKKAGDIARPVGASIVVLITESVPYPLPLNKPPVRFDDRHSISGKNRGPHIPLSGSAGNAEENPQPQFADRARHQKKMARLARKTVPGRL